MEVKCLSSIEELENEERQLEQRIQDSRRHESQGRTTTPIFRGHTNAEWKLETTLERFSSKEFNVLEYNCMLEGTEKAVRSLTGKQWNFTSAPNLHDYHLLAPPNYEYMVYARHHGFPSPLLDWTRSIYVALYFAYEKANPDKEVSIYAYIDTPTGVQTGSIADARLGLIGPNVATHARHFQQQAQYTFAAQKVGNNWLYRNHEIAFSNSNGVDQDILYKYILPGSLRSSVLDRLNKMNINAYTLFGNEEGLMNKLAFEIIR